MCDIHPTPYKKECKSGVLEICWYIMATIPALRIPSRILDVPGFSMISSRNVATTRGDILTLKECSLLRTLVIFLCVTQTGTCIVDQCMFNHFGAFLFVTWIIPYVISASDSALFVLQKSRWLTNRPTCVMLNR